MGSVIHVCLFLLLQVAASCCFDDFDSIVIEFDGKLIFYENPFNWGGVYFELGAKIR